MAPSYLTPGVYVEELPSAGRPIAGVGTSIAAFIGFAEMGPRNKPTLVTNWAQFQSKFGGLRKEYYLAHSVYGYFNNGGGVAYIVNVAAPLAPRGEVAATEGDKPAFEVYAIKEGLKAGDVSVEVADFKADPDSKLPLDPEAGTPFSINIKAAGKDVETFGPLNMSRESAQYVETVVNGASQYVWLDIPASKSAILPAPKAGSTDLAAPAAAALDTNAVSGDIRERSGIAGLEAVEDVTIVCAPDLMSAYNRGLIDEDALIALQKAMVEHCERMGNRVAIVDSPLGLDPQEIKAWRSEKLMVDSSYAALYYPWIKVLGPDGKLMAVPPSGHMAGIWARTDNERGVHKAPANEVVRGAVQMTQDITGGEQSILNPDGINCIRSFGAMGLRVWGARTLAASDASWKYINVRRLFNYVEASIKGGTNWAVFEPNDFSLWQRLKRDITSFLLGPYRNGAFFGATQDQAFFVKCDAENNPPDQIDAGMVVVEIGICPVKPAEFVIFRVQQLATGG